MGQHKLTPEEILSIAGEPGTPLVAAELSGAMFAFNPEFMAGMMLTIQDAILGTCECEVCTSFRNMAPIADEFLGNMAGGDIG